MWKNFCLADELEISEIKPGFPLVQINNAHASASVSLYGGQLLSFKPHEQSEPVIWLSEQATFSQNKAIRGGIPICWPWFGAFAANDFLADTATFSIKNLPAHGYARTSLWEIASTQAMDDGGTQLVLQLAQENIPLAYQALNALYNCALELTITVSQNLKLELKTVNQGATTLPISQALHSYFNISNIHDVSLKGLEQSDFIDKLTDIKSCQQASLLRFSAEMDRVYYDNRAEIMLRDPGFKRQIKIQKSNALSTIVWNPWQDKASQMDDIGDNAWLNMVCIEAGNVLHNQSFLSPGECLKVACLIQAGAI